MSFSKNVLKAVEKVLAEKYGISVSGWGAVNPDGYIRPRAKHGNKDIDSISVKVLTNGRVLIYDFSGDLLENSVLNLHDLSISAPTKADIAELIKQQKKNHAEKLKRFQDTFATITKLNQDTKDHELYSIKNLKPPESGVTFLDKKGNVVIPFYSDWDQTEPTGAQVRSVKEKWAISGSTLKDKFLVLQRGETDKVFSLHTVLLSESFTTALEVAEVFPQHTVVCVAGIGNMRGAAENIRNTLLERKTKPLIVWVMDKTKNNARNATLDELISSLNGNNTPYLQIDKFEPRFLHLTDWNELALEFGKDEVRRILINKMQGLYPQTPQVLNRTDKGYWVVSNVTQKPAFISDNDVKIGNLNISNMGFWEQYEELNPSASNKHLTNWFNECSKINTNKNVRGLGVFRENNTYIANTSFGCYTIDESGLKPFFETTLGQSIYINMVDCQDPPDFNKLEFTLDDFKKLLGSLEDIYGFDKAQCYGILGWIIQGIWGGISGQRVHAWFTGVTGTGKSQLLERYVGLLCKGISTMLIDSTVAGVQQTLTTEEGASHSPFLTIDEGGADTFRDKRMMQELIKLSRHMATNSDDMKTLRGTREGSVRVQKARCAVGFASTTLNHYLDDFQDLSRFLIFPITHRMRLNTPKEHEDHIEMLRELNPRFLASVVKATPLFLDAYFKVGEVLAPRFEDIRSKLSHKERAVTTCVAAMVALIAHMTEKPVTGVLGRVVANLDPFIEQQLETHLNRVDQKSNLLKDILLAPIEEDRQTMTLIECLTAEFCREKFKLNYGLWYSERARKVYIDKSSFRLSNLLENTRLCRAPIVNVESRLKDAVESNPDVFKNTTTKIDGKSSRVYTINVSEEIIKQFIEIEDNDEA